MPRLRTALLTSSLVLGHLFGNATGLSQPGWWSWVAFGLAVLTIVMIVWHLALTEGRERVEELMKARDDARRELLAARGRLDGLVAPEAAERRQQADPFALS